MGGIRRIIQTVLLAGALGVPGGGIAAPPGRVDSAKLLALPAPGHSDDTLEHLVTERNRRLYDSIASKSQRRAVPRLLYRLLFRSGADSLESGELHDEASRLAPYADRIIGEIRIERANPFSDTESWAGRTGNMLHVLTRERIIRRDLLFKSGQRFDPELIVRTQQLLLSRAYISDADILVQDNPQHPGHVDIVIRTRDSWSIRVDAAARSEKRISLGLSEVNLFGTGNRLKVETNLRYWGCDYGGNVVGYEIPNLFGSFLAVEAEAGRNFFEEVLRIQVSKDLLKPTDYEVGASYANLRDKTYFVDRDSSEIIRARTLDLWGGWSYYLHGLRSSIYLTGHYNRARFTERPEIAAGLHPALHDCDRLLGGIGLYRERLYRTSMVYGFGRKEYLATGYRAELLGGYSWEAYRNLIYAGGSLRTGGLTSLGYLVGGLTLGSFIDSRTGEWNRSAFEAEVLWVSNLLAYRRKRIRQFLALNYTRGWNRLNGYEERLRFTDENGLQALDAYAIGTNRFILNSETVMFTPIQPWGFRFAFFGFLDVGTLGYSGNPFRNAGFTTFGLGMRIRNERLVFGTLQIRLGLAFGKGGLAGCDYVSLTNSKHFGEYRFRPTRPEIVGFR